MHSFIGMKKKFLQTSRFLLYKHDGVIEELRIAEREFGELLAEKWDVVNADSNLQKKALMGAKRIKELRLLLETHRILERTIQ
jgi:hypothetical protein